MFGLLRRSFGLLVGVMGLIIRLRDNIQGSSVFVVNVVIVTVAYSLCRVVALSPCIVYPWLYCASLLVN